MKNWAPDDITRMIANPLYCLPSVSKKFIEPHPTIINEDQWVAAGVKLIKDVGPEPFLRLLLANLKG